METEYRNLQINVAGHVLDVWCNIYSTLPPILLIHGIGASGAYFMPLAKELINTYSVFVLTLPGYGNTPKRTRSLTIEELADSVIAFVKQYQITKPVLIGHSMGCQVIASAARKEPNLFYKLILFAPTVNDEERTLLWQGFRLLQDGFKEPVGATALLLRDYSRMGFVQYLQAAASMLHHHIERDMKDCLMPILIVRGENDKVVPAVWVHTLITTTQGTQRATIPHAAHAAHYSAPSVGAQICTDFIQRPSS